MKSAQQLYIDSVDNPHQSAVLLLGKMDEKNDKLVDDCIAVLDSLYSRIAFSIPSHEKGLVSKTVKECANAIREAMK